MIKPYLLSLGAGLLAGILYSLLGVRSPAPPMIALIGLTGILLGEQVVPVARRMIERKAVMPLVRTGCAEHVLGRLPSVQDAPSRPPSPEQTA
jgi:XapX domain-containing protein